MPRNSLEYYIEGIKSESKIILGQAITLIESNLDRDKELARELLEKISYNQNSIRIGISGVPGVGKSTFIEAFGNFIIDNGSRVAVLAIDPSSQKTGGSILGDKTRMETLSRHPQAFIRPSPTKSTLGGVAQTTPESILLCEAAGYDVIIVETVGVGQSETAVRNMVDFFLLLMLAGAGDELQGVKKGIMEMADGLVINKADGDNIKHVNKSKAEYMNALHLLAPNETNWQPKVLSCSSLEKTGLNDVWDMIKDFQSITSQDGLFLKNRLSQNVNRFNDQLNNAIIHHALSHSKTNTLRKELNTKLLNGEINTKSALDMMLSEIFN